jgi:fructokinase
MKDGGLYSDLVQQDDHLPTCEVTVQLDADGQAAYIIPEPVSWDNIMVQDPLMQAVQQSSAIIYGSLACRDITSRDTLLKLLAKTSALKIFDVNLRHPHYTMTTIETLIESADVVKMNDDEAVLLIGGDEMDLKEGIMQFQKKYNMQTICVTRGANGAIVWHNHEFFEHPGFKVQVVDTVGAGDAFLATFVSGLLAGNPMFAILDKACKIGAFVAGKRGANPVYDNNIETMLH